MRLQAYYQYLPQERAPFFAFSMKLVLIRNKCYRCKLVCTSTMNEWCKILQDINHKGSDYFTENFQVKENKTKMRNIHPRFFHWQCLLHRPGFQHQIAAAPAAAVVLFSCSIYYLSAGIAALTLTLKIRF